MPIRNEKRVVPKSRRTRRLLGNVPEAPSLRNVLTAPWVNEGNGTREIRPSIRRALKILKQQRIVRRIAAALARHHGVARAVHTGRSFTQAELNALLDMGAKGIRALMEKQKDSLAESKRHLSAKPTLVVLKAGLLPLHTDRWIC